MLKRKVAPEHRKAADLIKRGLFAEVPEWMASMKEKGISINRNALDAALHEGIATRLENELYFPSIYLNEAFKLGKELDIDISLDKIHNLKKRVGRGVCNLIRNGNPADAMRLIEWFKGKEKPAVVKDIKGITDAIQELIPKLKSLNYGSDVVGNLVKFIDKYEIPLDKIHELAIPKKRILEYEGKYKPV